MSIPNSEDIIAQNEARRALRAEQVEANQERARQASTIQASIDATTASAWSRGREVRVTVASTGLLQSVEFAEKAEGMNPAALANLTLKTIREAMASVLESIDEIVEAVDADKPGSTGVGSRIRDSYRDTFAASLAHLEPEKPAGH